MADRNGRRPGRRTLTDALAKLPPSVQRTLADALELYATLAPPGATSLNVYPTGIPPTLPMREILKWAKRAKAGKPIPFTVDYNGGGKLPVTIQRPLTWTPHSVFKPPGAPRHPLTLERFLRFVEAHQDVAELGDRRLADHLTTVLREEIGPQVKPVTRAIVRARRQEADQARRRRSEKVRRSRKLLG